MTIHTLPGGAHKLPAGALANAWLSAAAAGIPAKWDMRYDRALQVEFYPHGVLLAGVSPNLVVCVQVPYTTSPGPAALYDQVLENEPLMRVVVDDGASGARGAKTMRDTVGRARKAAEHGTLLATLDVTEVVPEGGMLGTKVLQLAVDGMTLGECITIGTWSPAPWREAFPDAHASPLVSRSSLVREPADAFARLARVAARLPLEEGDALDWELHTLASGETVRYTKLDDGLCTYEVSVACAVMAEPGAPAPTIFRVTKPTGAPTDDDEDDDRGWEERTLPGTGDDALPDPDADDDGADGYERPE